MKERSTKRNVLAAEVNSEDRDRSAAARTKLIIAEAEKNTTKEINKK
jgi:hypothetical protein